ncbi:MAG TPA: hypothetical protein VES42_19445 [Pilimelia sp.]|nr:hypothetical protein [Pilimelia sp.]
MDEAADGEWLAAALTAWLDRLTFVDLTTDEVTARVIASVAEWAGGQGWRVYRRAPSVLPLPPPLSRQHSVLDVAIARPAGPPVAVEVDHTDRHRTVEKLLAEAAAGRVPIWVRWGAGRFVPPPLPVRMVTCEVTRYNGPAGQGRRHARVPAIERPPPAHSVDGAAVGAADALPIPFADTDG